MTRDEAKLMRELATAVRALLKVYEMLLPGIKYIAVPDYQMLNEAPLKAKLVLQKADLHVQGKGGE